MENNEPKILKIYAAWVYVKNLEESRKFYERILGLKFKFQEGDWIEFDLGDTSFALLQRGSGESVEPQKTRIMFEVNSVEAMQRKLTESRVKIVGGIRAESYGRLLTFEDPNGHWLELFEPAKRSDR